MASDARQTAVGAGAVEESRSSANYDDVVLPHLDAAYRLALWLMHNEHDAEDIVQEASLRAFRYLDTFTGGNERAWFLQIVRNTCYAWRGRHARAATDLFDEEQHSASVRANDPETLLLQTDTAVAIDRALCDLPERSRELLVLRELEGLSYRELSEAMGIPMGTVMSGLSRAREAFRGAVNHHLKRSGIPSSVHRPEEEADAVRA